MNVETKKALFSKKIVGSFIMLCLLFALLLIALFIVFNSSLGWFAANRDVTGTGMSVSLYSFDYELLVERTHEYERLKNDNVTPIYPGVAELIDLLGDENDIYKYDFEKVTTQQAGRLAMEMVNETYVVDSDDGYTKYFIGPGSYGTVTFYISLSDSNALPFETDLAVTIGAFRDDYSSGQFEVTEVTEQPVLDMLKGHLLLFTKRTGADAAHYKYDGLIEGELLHFDTADTATFEHVTESKTFGEGANAVTRDDYYRVTLYWVWPLTYESIVNNIDADDNDPDKAFPSELADYLGAHPEYFLAAYLNSSDREELNYGYNDGDQMIGENAHYITVYISPL